MLPPVERPLPGEWDLETWNKRAEADEPDVPETIPEELWDFAVWQQRAEALLAACRALAPDAAIEKEQLGEWYLLARARDAFELWERLRTRQLVEALRQAVAAHRPYNPIYDLDLYMEEWRRLPLEDRIACYHSVRKLNARRKADDAAQVAADRQARSVYQKAHPQPSNMTDTQPLPVPEELWNPATWRRRAEALLDALYSYSLEPNAEISAEHQEELALLQRAREAYAPWQRLRSWLLAYQLRQLLEIHAGKAPGFVFLMSYWSQLSDADRIEMHAIVRDLNREHRESRKADRRARIAYQQARRQTRRS